MADVVPFSMAHRVPVSKAIDGSRAPSPALSSAGDAFSAIFDTSGEALVLIDAAGAIQRANRRARELLRLRDANFREAVLKDVLSGSAEQLAGLWSERDAANPRSLETSLANGFPVRVTLRAVLPVSEHLLLCLEDGSITQRAEAHWRQADAELRAVLESVRAAIVLYDSSGGVRFCNARFMELFSLDARDVDSLSTADYLEELLAPRFHSPKAFAAPWHSYLAGSGEPQHDQLELMRPTRRVIERFSRPVVDVAGSTVGWMEAYSETVAERQTQSKMLQTEKMAALGQLVSGIAHELNNPLTAIMGYAQLLLGHGLKPSQRAEAGNVYQEAERARSIVKNLLYFARENPPERAAVHVNEIIERTLALRSYELRLEDISVECDLDPRLPETMADRHQLQQVVLNLVVNAEQALLEGHGRGHIWIRTRHILENDSRNGGGQILLEVADDGPGIPPSIAWRVFDPFFTTKPAGIGTGLGLSIVYGIVHQHGGKVTLDNQPGAGAKFVVDLPVTPAPAGGGAIDSTGPTHPAEAVPSSRVLVIEDEPTVAQLIVDVLREEGHEAEGVLDSNEGLKRLYRRQYDLLICDLRMPCLDGQAIYETLGRVASPIRDRILFVTGDVLAPRTRDFLARNTLPYLTKPFLVDELKLAVNRLLVPKRDIDSASRRIGNP